MRKDDRVSEAPGRSTGPDVVRECGHHRPRTQRLPTRIGCRRSRCHHDRAHPEVGGRAGGFRRGNDFGRTDISFLRKLRGNGCRVELYYFWLPSAEAAIQRVQDRVANGGHNIPEATIRQRYTRSMRNFWTEYQGLTDLWAVYHNGGPTPRLTASGSRDGEPVVADADDWQTFLGVVTNA